MLKSIYKPLLVAGVVIIGLASCKKNNLVIDQDPLQPPTFSKFNVLKSGDTLKTYYISSANTPMKIPIGITTVADVDRTIQLCYTSSSALQGIQYTAPTTIKIPAGKTVDSLALQGIFSGYPTSTRKDTLDIRICGGDVPGGAYYQHVVVIMRKYCDVVLANLAGSYTDTREPAYGPYTTTLTNVVSTGATTATAKITNLYDDGWVPINCTLDWTDPANFKVTIPLQNTGGSTQSPTQVRTSSATASTFSSCDRSITLYIDGVTGSTVSPSNYKIVMK